MQITDFVTRLKCLTAMRTTNNNEWEVVTNIKYPGGFRPKFYLKNISDKWYFCDNKNVLKHMNELYDLNSKDVVNSIAEVLKLYDFVITSGEIFAYIPDEPNIDTTFYNFVTCIGQLVNMKVFFDIPSE